MAPGGAVAQTETQAQLEEIELGSQEEEVRVRTPRPWRSPPPPLRSCSRPSSVVDRVATRSSSASAVWHYPRQSVDDDGPGSPLMPISNSVEAPHEQPGGEEKRRSVSTVRSVTTRKSGSVLVGPRAPVSYLWFAGKSGELTLTRTLAPGRRESERAIWRWGSRSWSGCRT